MTTGSVAAIVPAARRGRRLGGKIAKPFVRVNGHPLIAHTLQALQASPAIRWIVLVVHPRELPQARRLLRRHRITKALEPCAGGATRAESVARGFTHVPTEARWVLIHDGARPCVRPALIQRAVPAAKRYGAVACGLPASLTVKAVDANHDVRLTLDRDSLWFVQTPQVFRRDWFAQALERAQTGRAEFPDDAAVVEAGGFTVRMVPGDPLNLKVTSREDLELAKAILTTR